mmetsp:Transcript_7816/g.19403  ORF Transcript_7816/g.19403 Transcript_7816/m.19403 type:complete len:106 (+) Transcript_7816:633-950(+)
MLNTACIDPPYRRSAGLELIALVKMLRVAGARYGKAAAPTKIGDTNLQTGVSFTHDAYISVYASMAVTNPPIKSRTSGTPDFERRMTCIMFTAMITDNDPSAIDD